MTNPLHLQSTGSFRPQSPKTIAALAQARTSFWRVIFSGACIVILTLTYTAALLQKIDGAQSLLPMLATSIGYLLGSKDKPSPSE